MMMITAKQVSQGRTGTYLFHSRFYISRLIAVTADDYMQMSRKLQLQQQASEEVHLLFHVEPSDAGRDEIKTSEIFHGASPTSVNINGTREFVKFRFVHFDMFCAIIKSWKWENHRT